MEESILSIIILNYNGEFLLKRLLPSIEKYFLSKTKYKTNIIVVDNCSTDNSISYLKTIPFINIIKNSSNSGFAAGNNIALKNNTSKYILLLNSDTEFNKKSNLDELIRILEINTNIGIISPKVILNTGEIDHACHRGEPTLWASFCYFSKLSDVFPNIKIFGKYNLSYLSQNNTHEIQACTGAAMLIRQTVINKIGLLDDNFFMYAEDLDFCRRTREAGYKIFYTPRVNIIHHKYKSGIQNKKTKTSAKSRYWFYYSMILYYKKYHKHASYNPLYYLLKFIVKLKTHSIPK